MDAKNKETREQQIAEAVDRFPGVAVNNADDESDNARLVKERTCMLNNNPRNHDL